MSPILTRPVREQLEHDRVIRLLQARYKRKNEVIINPGSEQNQSVTVGELVVYPDLLLFAEGGRKLLGTIEVETGESVNALEARAEWGVFTKLRVPLHLYVPPTSVDAARRLCAEYDIPIAELWTFHTTFDQVRFTMIYRSPDAPTVKSGGAPKSARVNPLANSKPASSSKSANSGSKAKSASVKAGSKSRPAAKSKTAARATTAANAKAAKGKPAAKKSTPAARAKPNNHKNSARLRNGPGAQAAKKRR